MQDDSEPKSPRVLAERLGESPTDLANVARHLVRAGILRSHRGVTGGVVLGQEPRHITLLAIAHACQGTLLGDAFAERETPAETCALHQACVELHRAITSIPSRWTLAQFQLCEQA